MAERDSEARSPFPASGGRRRVVRQADFGCSIIACRKRPPTVKTNGVARFNAAAAKLRAQSFTLDSEAIVCGPTALRC